MMYSIVGILALIVLFITNRDFFFYRTDRSPAGKDLQPDGGASEQVPQPDEGASEPAQLPDGAALESAQQAQLRRTQRYYRFFLFGIIVFYLADVLWGFFDACRLPGLLFIDTSVYFLVMAATLLFWTRYVVSYLHTSNNFEKLVHVIGSVFFTLELIAVILNFFLPVLFWTDEAGVYQPGPARHASFALQCLLFLIVSLHILYVAAVSKGATRRHYLAIGLFGIAMVVFIALQIFYTLLPFYSMGYMIGTCLIHSFVVEDEKDVYREELEKALERERLQLQELKESRRSLREALSVAQKASRAKTAFLSNMSHEIRTPMNAIIGLNSIAMEEPSISAAVREHLVKINSSAHHLLDIINDILDMTRIESGSLEMKHEDFSFVDCMVYVNNIIGSQCRGKGLAYEYSTKGNVDGWYCGDAVKLKQVLINILGNSVKFTPAGGSIRFTAEEKSRFNGQVTFVFTITDTGIGISEEFLPHIFDAFSKEDSSLTTKYGSTGLGMAITKSIVTHMNGHIDLKSKKGEGTTFTVTVTFAESNTARGTVQPGAAAGTCQPEELTDLTGRHVLLAEDMEINAEIVVMMLKQLKVEVDVAQNGKIAVQLFTEHPEGYYDAVLMDMRMQEMDGLEATKCIRSSGHADAERIPIIALTANAFEEDVKRSLQAGLNAHLSKPIEPARLFSVLGTFIGASKN